MEDFEPRWKITLQNIRCLRRISHSVTGDLIANWKIVQKMLLWLKCKSHRMENENGKLHLKWSECSTSVSTIFIWKICESLKTKMLFAKPKRSCVKRIGRIFRYSACRLPAFDWHSINEYIIWSESSRWLKIEQCRVERILSFSSMLRGQKSAEQQKRWSLSQCGAL